MNFKENILKNAIINQTISWFLLFIFSFSVSILCYPHHHITLLITRWSEPPVPTRNIQMRSGLISVDRDVSLNVFQQSWWSPLPSAPANVHNIKNCPLLAETRKTSLHFHYYKIKINTWNEMWLIRNKCEMWYVYRRNRTVFVKKLFKVNDHHNSIFDKIFHT